MEVVHFTLSVKAEPQKHQAITEFTHRGEMKIYNTGGGEEKYNFYFVRMTLGWL